MSVGLVFVSTGGSKMQRALRSLRKTEPELHVHILFDKSSNTFQSDPDTTWFEKQDDITVRWVENTALVNGMMNKAIAWMAEEGHSHACVFHDDVVFSPFLQSWGQLSSWFYMLTKDSELANASGLTMSFIQAFVPREWRRSPEAWDKVPLESKRVWDDLLPPREFIGGLDRGHIHQPDGLDFYVQHYWIPNRRPFSRLGPTGYILPTRTWEHVGRFDETEGMFFDIAYPMECASRDLPPVLWIPNIPHLHLHNQSLILDPALGIWADTIGAIEKHYGPIGRFWEAYPKVFR